MVTRYQQLPLSGHNHAKGNLFVFVLAAPACSKRSVREDGIKKSDEVGAGRENEIPLYSNPSNNYIIQTAYVKKEKNSKNREPLSVSRKHLFKFILKKCKFLYIRNGATVP